jgi:hypothetical protein
LYREKCKKKSKNFYCCHAWSLSFFWKVAPKTTLNQLKYTPYKQVQALCALAFFLPS